MDGGIVRLGKCERGGPSGGGRMKANLATRDRAGVCCVERDQMVRALGNDVEKRVWRNVWSKGVLAIGFLASVPLAYLCFRHQYNIWQPEVNCNSDAF